MIRRFIGVFVVAICGLLAQDAPPAAMKPQPPADAVPKPDYTVDPGTKIPLSLINSVSTKNSTEGDRVYLETVFPVVLRGKMVIPVGSYVAGTVTKVTRPGRVKGRGEFYIRFDSLTLPNGVTRDFRASIGSLDGRASEDLDRKEGSIKSEGNKSGDVRTIAEGAATGASVGALAGGITSGHAGMGAGIGAAAGATAGLIGVLVTRGPDAVLARGTTMEMVLDRPVGFMESDLDFSKAYQGGTGAGNGPGPGPSQKDKRASRWPF